MLFKSEFQFKVSNAIARHFGHTWGGVFASLADFPLDGDGFIDLPKSVEEFVGMVVATMPDRVALDEQGLLVGGLGILSPGVNRDGDHVGVTGTGRHVWKVFEDRAVLEVHTRPFFDGGCSRPVAAAEIAEDEDGQLAVVNLDHDAAIADRHIAAMARWLEGIDACRWAAESTEWTEMVRKARRRLRTEYVLEAARRLPVRLPNGRIRRVG